jgi:hypothetical protein
MKREDVRRRVPEGYFIEAWLEEGMPCLAVREACSGMTRLQWRLDPSLEEPVCDRTACTEHHACMARKGLQRLFKDLFLLSCGLKLGEREAAGQEACSVRRSPTPGRCPWSVAALRVESSSPRLVPEHQGMLAGER